MVVFSIVQMSNSRAVGWIEPLIWLFGPHNKISSLTELLLCFSNVPQIPECTTFVFVCELPFQSPWMRVLSSLMKINKPSDRSRLTHKHLYSLLRISWCLTLVWTCSQDETQSISVQWESSRAVKFSFLWRDLFFFNCFWPVKKWTEKALALSSKCKKILVFPTIMLLFKVQTILLALPVPLSSINYCASQIDKLCFREHFISCCYKHFIFFNYCIF